ncbi:hypothetical protein M3D15_06915 [Pseudoclavibacter alba]|uniref:DUF8175 domain-containing protein n=1 Tax=Pseudoclavibacter albus TaxID=272241 RepID=A0ABT2HXM0_9MICO|nr:hypothetical protein [Pseudoclavibacter alba]MCT2043062.1 hypothetical protein [Pseudoclavibacter alba]
MDEMKPWWKTWPVLGVAALLVVLALGGGGMILSSKLGEAGGSESVPASPSSGGSEAAPAVPAGDGEASVCGLTAREDELGKLETEAPVTEWESLGNQLVTKQNDEHGPGVVEDDGFRYCYARTPEGVLFAAANFVTFGSSSDGNLTSKAAQKLIDAGDRQEEFEAQMKEGGSGGSAPIIAYRVDRYSASSATVTLVLEFEGTKVAGTLDFAWSGGDWKVRAPGTGNVGYRMEKIENLAGYVPWGVANG